MFKFNNLWLVLFLALKFCINVAKGLKLKVRKFLGLVFTFRGKTLTGEGVLCFFPSPSWIGLRAKKRIKRFWMSNIRGNKYIPVSPIPFCSSKLEHFFKFSFREKRLLIFALLNKQNVNNTIEKVKVYFSSVLSNI